MTDLTQGKQPKTCPSWDDPARDTIESDCYCYDWEERNCNSATHTRGTGNSYSRSCGCHSGGRGTVRKCVNTDYDKTIEGKFDCCTGNSSDSSKCNPDYCSRDSINCTNVYANYCKTGVNINSIRCERLKTLDPVLYNEGIEKYCITDNSDGSRFKEEGCKSFCKETGKCETKLGEVCLSKNPADNSWKGVCGCYYDEDIYAKFGKTMEEKWKVPEIAFNGKKQCTFPLCASSFEAYRLKGECDPLNITSCLQQVTVDATGAVLNGGSVINISQNAKCQTQYIKKTGGGTDDTTPGGGGGTTPGGDATNVENGGSCVYNRNCKSDNCTAGKCAAAEEPPPKSNKTLYWVLGIIGAVLLIGLISGLIYYFSKKNSTPPPPSAKKPGAVVKKLPSGIPGTVASKKPNGVNMPVGSVRAPYVIA